MISKFFEGLTFGAGFAISFLLIAWLGAGVVVPMLFTTPGEATVRSGPSLSERPSSFEEPGPQFHELPLEEQIKTASVIALARYELAPDGKQKAIIKEFLKKDPNTTIYYNIGDEYPGGSFYPKDKTSYGDGVIVFFVGSPASMRMSISYTGDRIHSLGDIPLQLFREKCEADA
jgi:hypothetical protein